MDQKPDVFLNHDYRKFLKQWFEYKKLYEKKFSLRGFCKLCGISQGHLSDIISCRRPLTQATFNLLIPHLDLAETEKSFLWHLVLLSDASSLEGREAAFKHLSRFKAYQDKHSDDMSTHEYLTAWYYVAIRELSLLPDFQMDTKWIRKKLKFHVTNLQVKEALRFLVKNDFLLIDPKTNKVKETQKLIKADSEILKMAMAHGHREVMDLASQSIYLNKTEEHHLVNYTLSLPHRQFSEVKAILSETLSRIQKISEKAAIEETDTVYSISMYAFPLSNQNDGGEDAA